MRDYAAYADPLIGRWSAQHTDGHKDPGVRLLVKPLLNLFHGEAGSKRWKNAVDGLLKEVRELIRAVGGFLLFFMCESHVDAGSKRWIDAVDELLQEERGWGDTYLRCGL